MAGNKSSPSDGVRVRVIDERSHHAVSMTGYTLGSGLPQPWTKQESDYAFSGTQYTESEGHPFLSSKRKGQLDLGGDFYTQKVNAHFGGAGDRFVRAKTKSSPSLGYQTYQGTGICCAIDPKSVLYASTNIKSSEAQLDVLGATAISRVKPTNPVASLTAALAEIHRDGLPHLVGSRSWRDQALNARNAGNEYLNAQFGWAPLVNDVMDFTHGVTHAQSVIEQYKRGIGKVTRRSYDFPIERSIKETIVSKSAKPFTTPIGAPNEFNLRPSDAAPGWLMKKQEVLQRSWFRGAFSYYFPAKIAGSEKLGDLAILAHQLGLEPTPDVLWQVTPWSWAVDWFSNTGDVISNWSAFHTDGLVMRYGYVMQHTLVTDTYSLVGCRAINGIVQPVADVVVVTETKQRRRANPYGFGVSWDGLSTFQASILAALGISRR